MFHKLSVATLFFFYFELEREIKMGFRSKSNINHFKLKNLKWENYLDYWFSTSLVL